MNELRAALADVVAERIAFTSDPCVNLRTGLTFLAEIEPVDPLIVATELGEDPREVVIVHVTDTQDAAGINDQDQIQMNLGQGNVVYQVVKRRNNAANLQVDFWCRQVTNLDT